MHTIPKIAYTLEVKSIVEAREGVSSELEFAVDVEPLVWLVVDEDDDEDVDAVSVFMAVPPAAVLSVADSSEVVDCELRVVRVRLRLVVDAEYVGE